MASWLRRFLLKTGHSSVFILALSSSAISYADEQQLEQTAPLKIQTEQLIQPEIERRTVELSNIDTEDFEVTAYTGILSIEDFGTSAVIGARLAYHINEDFFIEGSLAKSTIRKSSAERVGPFTLPGSRDLIYYNVSLGYNLLPGESFLTRNTSFNSAVYLIAGAGNTKFLNDDKLTINFGGGFRLLATDWLAMHIDVRNHIFNIDILAENKTANNLEVTFGISAFF